MGGLVSAACVRIVLGDVRVFSELTISPTSVLIQPFAEISAVYNCAIWLVSIAAQWIFPHIPT